MLLCVPISFRERDYSRQLHIVWHFAATPVNGHIPAAIAILHRIIHAFQTKCQMHWHRAPGNRFATHRTKWKHFASTNYTALFVRFNQWLRSHSTYLRAQFTHPFKCINNWHWFINNYSYRKYIITHHKYKFVHLSHSIWCCGFFRFASLSCSVIKVRFSTQKCVQLRTKPRADNDKYINVYRFSFDTKGSIGFSEWVGYRTECIAERILLDIQPIPCTRKCANHQFFSQQHRRLCYCFGRVFYD